MGSTICEQDICKNDRNSEICVTCTKDIGELRVVNEDTGNVQMCGIIVGNGSTISPTITTKNSSYSGNIRMSILVCLVIMMILM